MLLPVDTTLQFALFYQTYKSKSLINVMYKYSWVKEWRISEKGNFETDRWKSKERG